MGYTTKFYYIFSTAHEFMICLLIFGPCCFAYVTLGMIKFRATAHYTTKCVIDYHRNYVRKRMLLGNSSAISNTPDAFH